MQQHDMTKWLFRIVLVLGAIGFGTMYSIRHDWSKGWMPSLTEDYRPPAAEPGPGLPAALPAAPAAPSVAAPAASGEAPRCYPIGRTAQGEYVYSMDCAQLPEK